MTDWLRLADLAAQVYITTKPKYLVRNNIVADEIVENGILKISVRGTVITSLPNILVDGFAMLWPAGRFGLVHRGFWGAANDLWAEIGERVTSWPGDVEFCGHSLGAIVAVMLAGKAALAGKYSSVLALAPPKGGGFLFKRALAGVTMVLVRRANDAIPLVPAFLWFFEQPGTIVHVNPNAIMELVSAHSVAGYVSDLTAWAKTNGFVPDFTSPAKTVRQLVKNYEPGAIKS